MGTVLDYSGWRPPSPSALVQHGVTGVMRYVAPHAWGWPKAITRGELDGLLAAGVQVGFNFENNPADYRGGTSAGATNGSTIATAMAELGLDVDVPVFVSYDTEIPAAQFATCLDYHLAIQAKNPGRPIDGYGENALLEFLAGQGALSRGWMSESTSFPGNDGPKAHTVLQQHFGQQISGLPGAYDVNTIIKADWGQIPRPFPPSPTPTPTPVEDDMIRIVSPTWKRGQKWRGVIVNLAARSLQQVGVHLEPNVPPQRMSPPNNNPWFDAVQTAVGLTLFTNDFDPYDYTMTDLPA